MHKFLSPAVRVVLLVAIFLMLSGNVFALWIPPSAVMPAGSAIYAGDFADLINNVAIFLIFSSVVIVVIFIIWSGITYTAAGADQTKVKAAKDRLKTGIIGGLIIFGVGTILETVRIFIQDPNNFFG